MRAQARLEVPVPACTYKPAASRLFRAAPSGLQFASCAFGTDPVRLGAIASLVGVGLVLRVLVDTGTTPGSAAEKLPEPSRTRPVSACRSKECGAE
jgi:hypothetical protein